MKRFRDHFLSLLPYTLLSSALFYVIMPWTLKTVVLFVSGKSSAEILQSPAVFAKAVVAGFLAALIGAVVRVGHAGLREE
jgi:hypothetical protein